MPKPGVPKKPLGGILGGIPDDVLEKLKDQAQDAVKGLQDAATGGGDAGGGEDSGDSGIELQGGKPDPTKIAQQAQQQGLTPAQLLEKRKKEKEQEQFHRRMIDEWAQRGQQLRKDVETKQERAKEEEKQRKEQEMLQLQEEEAKAAVLQAPKKSKPGRGTAFAVTKAKQDTMAEMGRTPST